MRSLLNATLSSDILWEFSFVLVGFYLLFHPVLANPTSLAVALGGGLLLLLLRTISPETLQVIGKAWCLFLVYLLASSLWSVSPGITLQSAGLVFLGTILFAMARMNSPESQNRLERIGLLMALIAALMGIYQWLYGFERLVPLLQGLGGEEHEILAAAIHNKRATGPFVTHGALASFLILFIPVGFVTWKTQMGFKKRLFGVVTLILIVGLFTTQSVGACFCLTLAVLVVLLKRRSNTAWAIVAAGALGILALILARGIQSWLLAAFGTRLILWKAALALFENHPLLGSGLGTFGEVYQQAGLPLETGARFTHNLFLQVLIETGLMGLLIFLAVLVDLVRRFKVPTRWEGWGLGTGVLAFLLFSLLDLPFQMPEVIWVFAVMAGRLELRPEGRTQIQRKDAKTRRKNFFEKNSEFVNQCAQLVLLPVFFICGLWPPMRSWNFALLAGALWVLAVFFQQKFDKVPLWVFLGTLFIALRAFVSPSALGTVWFFEIVGILLVFFLIVSCFENSENFLRWFCGLGLFWALKVWWEPFHYAAPGFSNWIHFQYSDVKDWIIFPDPKQVGIFLVPLVFLLWKWLPRWGAVWRILIAALTMLRLKAFGAFFGIGVGFIALIKTRNRIWIGTAALALVLGLLLLRSLDPSPTKWERFEIWGSALKVWERSPMVGVGPGAFAGLYHQVKSPRMSGVSYYLMDAQYSHNEFLEWLTAFGLIGFGFGVFLLMKVWQRVQDPTRRAGLVGLGAASFVDFCLHTPLIALQGVGLLTDGQPQKPRLSFIGGFLALGLAGGLFGSPIFLSGFINRAETQVSQNQLMPADLRGLETAERFNAWDARITASKADYLEKLYLETKDKVWARKSDEAFDRVMDMEKLDGQWRLKNAERLTLRLGVDSAPEFHRKAAKAWDEADKTLPFNAFVNFEKGLFLVKEGSKEEALLEFEAAELKEPNFAAALVNEGLLLKEKGENEKARTVFQKALEVYHKWKYADRIDPLEKQMVGLPPETVEFLSQEAIK